MGYNQDIITIHCLCQNYSDKGIVCVTLSDKTQDDLPIDEIYGAYPGKSVLVSLIDDGGEIEQKEEN